ncbi:30S ribosomal protein S5 [Candidatus Nanohalococcus occultus]|uniref:30S ribosomal protein S5 n=1 Tax=Candidatus Nanohalococcus occultus TaxID=2978047 RepID=UPI0039E0DCB6
MSDRDEAEEVWNPKTKLGKKVANGQISNIKDAMNADQPIMEPEIVDQLINLNEEVILIGGTPGKGGGKRRTVSKRTARMHKSGARYNTKAMVVVGDKNNVVGLGYGEANDTRAAIESATREAKLNLIEVQHGSGSWEDQTEHTSSIPIESSAKVGSVQVSLKPAPKGTGLAASDDVKKLLELGGISDVWVQTQGKTQTRENLLKASFEALENINEVVK